jgi:hypothetical protein
MTDLVQRLQSERSALCLEAAREIERTAAMLREAKAEIIRLRDAKRSAMQIANERAKEVVDPRMRLAESYAVDVTQSGCHRRGTDCLCGKAVWPSTRYEVVFLEDLPKNATGKVDRRVLRERYAAAHPPVEQSVAGPMFGVRRWLEAVGDAGRRALPARIEPELDTGHVRGRMSVGNLLRIR